jgi:hypothetical protein
MNGVLSTTACLEYAEHPVGVSSLAPHIRLSDGDHNFSRVLVIRCPVDVFRETITV